MKKLKRLAAVLLVLTLSLSLAAPVFASNYESSENAYHKMVYFDERGSYYYSNYTTSGMPQAAYAGTNFTTDQLSNVVFTVHCMAGTTQWRGARNSLPGNLSAYQQVSGYTTNRNLSNTLFRIGMEDTGENLNFARSKVQRPSARSVQAAESVWTYVTKETSAFAEYN